MKRQPIASAAAFFVLQTRQAEIHSSAAESVGKSAAPSDCIFRGAVLY